MSGIIKNNFTLFHTGESEWAPGTQLLWQTTNLHLKLSVSNVSWSPPPKYICIFSCVSFTGIFSMILNLQIVHTQWIGHYFWSSSRQFKYHFSRHFHGIVFKETRSELDGSRRWIRKQIDKASSRRMVLHQRKVGEIDKYADQYHCR